MLGDSFKDDIIDLEKSLDDSELLFSSKVNAVKEKKADCSIASAPSLFEENVPESFLTTVPHSPPFRKVSDIKFYRPPTPAKPFNKRPLPESDEEEDNETEAVGFQQANTYSINIEQPVSVESFTEKITRLARLNPNISFIPRLRRISVK